MKTVLFTLIMVFIATLSVAQNDTISKSDSASYRIVKTNGDEIIAKIIKQDRREILVMTNDGREMYIPQHVIKKIIPIKEEEYTNDGIFVGEDKFSTRYFITTNGLPIKKGEHYIQWNLFGPGLDTASFFLSRYDGYSILASS